MKSPLFLFATCSFPFFFSMLYLLLILCLLVPAFSFYCTPQCTYALDTGLNKYTPRCLSTDPNNCTACDPRFYIPTPSLGTCTMPAQSPYNYTFDIPSNNWNGPYPPVSLYGVNWIDINSVATLSINIQVSTIAGATSRPVAYYGVRCRFLFYISGNFIPTLRFQMNNMYSEGIQIVPKRNDDYDATTTEWIYTTPFMQYREEHFQLYISRTDGASGAFQTVAMKDTKCFLAYCVVNCLSCTNLSDCNQCASGFYLDPVTRYCTTSTGSCPQGTYPATNGLCQTCDPKCDSCTTSATTCNNCKNSGPFQSFLDGTSCVTTCPGVKIQDYNTHTCVCPLTGYATVGTSCTACPLNCLICPSTNTTLCSKCQLPYFLTVSQTQCVLTCPPTSYPSLYDDINICYSCNSLQCTQCLNTSTTCTKCAFPTNDRYLSNYACVYLCPDGYEGNGQTFVCDQCLLGSYSFENVCYSTCPEYYQARDDIRACVLPGGYPLNLTVAVENANMLRFQVKLPLGLSAANLSGLTSSWGSYVSISFITQTESKMLLNQRRMLQAARFMTLSNAIITNTSLTFYSSTVSATDLITSHTFKLTFADNLFTQKNVMYSISASNNTDNFPYIIHQYYALNLKPFYLLPLFIILIPLVLLLMQVRYIYRLLIELIHCIQLLGLTLFALYPHSIHPDLYSYVMGLDFANFSFMYNIPQSFILPCFSCKSIIGFAFVLGDMNWLRMIGSLLLCAVIMSIFCIMLWIFKCSRNYSYFYIKLVIDLITVKTLHAWFASLLYSGLNFSYNTTDMDMFMYGMYFIGYALLGVVLYVKIKEQYERGWVNVRFLFLGVWVVLLSLLSIAPMVICVLLVVCVVLEWAIVNGLNISQDQKKEQIDQKSDVAKKSQNPSAQTPLIFRFHTHLLRSMKPTTSFLVACIIMLQNEIIPIALISSILFLFLILILVDTYFQYHYHQAQQKLRLQKQSQKQAKPEKSRQVLNETKQDLRQDKETQFRDGNINEGYAFNYNEEDDVDDDVVANKFRKGKEKKSRDRVRGSVPVLPIDGKDESFIKNIQ